MIQVALLALSVIALFPLNVLAAGGSGEGGDATPSRATSRIRMVFNNQEVIVGMFESPASKDFMTLLPLTVELRDFARAEKIADLPRRLNTSGSPTPRNATGDFTYYAPWGNLAIFYKGFGSDSQLYVLGRIESGKEELARMNNDFTARIEKIE